MLIAVVGTVVIVQYVRTADERAMAGQEVAEVLVADAHIDAGTEAGAMADAVRTEELPVNAVADTAVGDLEQLEGLVTSADLVPGEQIVADRFVTLDDYTQQEDVEIPDGFQIVSIELSPERVVGGQVRPGDTVGILASFTGAMIPGEEPEDDDADDEDGDETEQAESTTGYISNKVLVANVQGEPTPGRNLDEEGNPTEAGEGAQPRPAEPPAPLTVSLAVDAEQAEKVVFAAEYGQMWLTLEPEDAEEDGAEIQTLESIYE